MLKRRRTAGFTFLELMIVIGILGILAAIAMPNYNRYRRQQNVQNAANDLTASLKRAAQEAKKGERFAGIRFVTDAQNGGLYYEVLKDINEDGAIDNTDRDRLDEDGNKVGLILQRFPSKDGVSIWGGGIANDKKLVFGRGGEVEASVTDVTYNNQTKGGYYTIMLSSKDGSVVKGETFKITVFWDGKVTVEKYEVN